jgi:radical SAM superfamily enzyme YgiQ (UPF0313 family)
MKKQKVSFVSVNFQQGPTHLNAYYLPYSVGLLWSYVSQFSEVTDKYELGEMLWRRDDIPVAVDKLKDSDIVGFSTYIWNRNYNYTLAKTIKKLYPHILIVFGGPEPQIEKADIFERYPFMDVVIKNEGEISFKNILLNRDNLESVKGILVNRDGKKIDTGVSKRIDKLDDIPSPYTSGLFQKIMADNPLVTWNGMLETNRGCPYMCTFCDWGSITQSKIKNFDLERVFAEIEWMGQNKLDHFTICDANFGIFPERDLLIADKLIETNYKYGYPRNYVINYAKNQKKEVVQIVQKFINSNFPNYGLTVSFQSLDEDVLANIKRKNLEINRVGEIYKLCEEANIPVYSELILGLPGETYDTWRKNFYRIFEAGNHNGIEVWISMLLENAELNLKQKEEFDIKSIHAPDYFHGVNNFDELREDVEITVATKDMPPEDFKKSLIFSCYLMGLHTNGITSYVSRVLNKKFGVSYADFYERLYDYFQRDEFMAAEFKSIADFYDSWSGGNEKIMVNNFTIRRMSLMWKIIISIVANNKIEHVLDLVEAFVRETYDVDEKFIDELIDFQRKSVIDFHTLKNYPIEASYNHDFYNYLLYNTKLETPVHVTFKYNGDVNLTENQYLEYIYWKRRENFGIAHIKTEKLTKKKSVDRSSLHDMITL